MIEISSRSDKVIDPLLNKMALFDIEGWSVPSAVAEESLSGSKRKRKDKVSQQQQNKSRTRNNDRSEKRYRNDELHDDGKKNNYKSFNNNNNNQAVSEQNIDSESVKKVSSEELQQLFESQFKGPVGNITTKSSVVPAAQPPKDVKQNSLVKQKLDVGSGKDQLARKHQKKRDHEPTIKSITPTSTTDISKPAVKLTALQQKMKNKLSGSRFRWINEKLYTISSEEAKNLIVKQPELYQEYHEGFRQQIQSWPENPVDYFVDRIKSSAKVPMPPPRGLPKDRSGTTIIADMGCGDAELSRQVASKYANANVVGAKNNSKKSFGRNSSNIVVHSFDLAKSNERVTVADVKHVPLEDNSVHIVIFCLSLMGTNFLDFIKEAHRILKPRGQLWISEIKSRFSDTEGEEFVEAIKKFGFIHKDTDISNLMFARFDFYKPFEDKTDSSNQNDSSAPSGWNKKQKKKFIEKEDDDKPKTPILKPCIYKKR
ncbi:methyltransferase-domain-containing protein [Lipomyces japonicus]|uniref:methyltransferase-domain-containing protein n=1 Tax=Lipomyces japonicus TaxID=56871 RepID=UPI0034CF8C79